MPLPVIKDLTLTDYLRELADDSLFPSAGASAGTTAAQGAALFAMVCRVNLRKLHDNPVAEPGHADQLAFWGRILEQADGLSRRCLELAQEDGAAYRDVVDGNPEGPAHAMEVPLEISRLSLKIIRLIQAALPNSYIPVRADAETALVLVRGSFRAALVIARHNLPLLRRQAERDNYVNLIDALKLKAELDPISGIKTVSPETQR